MSRVEDSTGTELLHVRSRWDYVRKKLKRRGVVEVNKAHPHHDMLCAIQGSIRKLLTEHPEAKAKDELLSEDFNQKIKFSVTTDTGKTYHFASYASPVFACVRSAVSIKEDDFLESLSPKDLPYLEFISNSRSGQDFYFSNNQRFILKTDEQKCVHYFLTILRDYLDHFHNYPHSLLVKFLGLYSIKKPRSRKKYFLVMQSIFYPTVRLEERFDIKGCLANRYQNPHPSGKKTILVLKDQNFMGEALSLGNQRDWFLTQLRADVDFLLTINVQDYSLLLGRHPLHVSEKKESVGNLVLRMKKSFGHEKSTQPLIEDNEETGATQNQQPDGDTAPHVHADGTPLHQNQTETVEMQSITVNQDTASPTESPLKQPSIKSPKKSPVKNNAVSPAQKRNVSFLRSLSDKDYLDSTGLLFHNRRLLVNSENSLHIVDGTDLRYYIGVIDFFTQFGCRQRIAKFFKDIKTCCGNHSTEPPQVYAERFYQFISERVV
ncbi:phosphatidylinositol 4-phosphate 5-kinase-like protein 1 isoform X2 [Mercenaria mercenaria]|uniref:phosphatidylinositol 4-phosphate 5-kinase-like protein 1 isoform X2 n=1 Tax=Mercenaria mercenaria TaxID=6596 RepID=UPI00234F5D01|nr:phosphatidylinositol 4-phosphate 5-kinase-like protein 1 isoform X2 [Mercenaria mercenaria]